MAATKKKIETVPSDPEKKTYLLEKRNGRQQKLTVPKDWKMTFGPTVPFERKENRFSGDGGTWALRLYENGDKLRAIFTDVRSFRDMDITISEKRVRTKRQAVSKDSDKGGKQVIAEARIEEWVDPDAPDTADQTPEEYLKLDYKSDDTDLEF